jgi:hypothetical protein
MNSIYVALQFNLMLFTLFDILKRD